MKRRDFITLVAGGTVAWPRVPFGLMERQLLRTRSVPLPLVVLGVLFPRDGG